MRVKGDSFIAEGYVRTFQAERDGAIIEREEFVAKKIGHDLARTNYDVDRNRRPAEQDAPNARLVVAPAQVRANSTVLGMGAGR